MAHQALIHGPCFIGDKTFIGFKAVIHDSVIGEHCHVGIGATVVGVQIAPVDLSPTAPWSTRRESHKLPPATVKRNSMKTSWRSIADRRLRVSIVTESRDRPMIPSLVTSASAGWGRLPGQALIRMGLNRF